MPAYPGDAVSDKTATAFCFTVEVDGSIIAMFTECSGLGLSIAEEKYEEGGENNVTLKFPGRVDYTNLTLKRGIAESTDLLDWVKGVMQGEHLRKNVSIRVLTPDLTEIQRWQFKDAFPVRWTGPSLQTTSNSVAVETLELAHNGFV